jgi:hypothetical protein
VTLDELLALPVVVPLWPTAGRALDLGRTATYSLAQRGEFPVPILRLGNQYKVPTAGLLRALGINDREVRDANSSIRNAAAAPDHTRAADDHSAEEGQVQYGTG